MSCKGEWDFEFISSKLTKKFISTSYRTLMSKKLFDMETALLPDTMYFVELVKKKDKLIEQKSNLYEQIAKLRRIARDIDTEISIYDNEITGQKTKKKFTIEFICQCPENCRGFIRASDFTCGVCEIKICKECRESISETHVCNPENIETANLLRKDSKPCPKCAAYIFKIDGCDQMFCTQCQTAFSWTTGEIERGKVHNPHYYEWMRTNTGTVPRDPDDIAPCDELIRYACLIDAMKAPQMRSHFIFQSGKHMKISEIHRTINEIQNDIMPEINDAIAREGDNKQLRINYLLGKIDREFFEKEIERKSRLVLKNNSINHCLDLYVKVMTENFRKFFESLLRFKFEEKTFLHDYEQIAVFTIENLKNICKMYGCSLKKIMTKIHRESVEKVSPNQ